MYSIAHKYSKISENQMFGHDEVIYSVPYRESKAICTSFELQVFILGKNKFYQSVYHNKLDLLKE